MSHASSDGILAGSGAGSPTRGIAAAPLTGATRYLAAAAYTDKTFRDKAIEIGEDEFRARAPELGIDADAVLQHCAVARRRTAWRDALLCLPLIFLAVTGIVESVIAYPDEILYIVEAFSLPLLIVWITAAAIVFTEKFSTQHLTLTGKFSAGGRDLASNTSPAQTAVATPANVVMYGAFSPFVGSGYDIGGWSFTINLEQASLDADAPDEFTTTELYDSLRAGFLRLSIDGLSISDRLYVDGRSIRNDPRLLTNILSRPASRLAPELVETYYSKAERGIRHYLCLEIKDWSGELVLSSFIRLQKTPTSLFVENSNFLLPPLKEEYYAIDKLSSSQMIRKTFGWTLVSLVTGPFLALLAPFKLWALVMHQLGKRGARRQRRREIRHDPLYNYGALQSIRELGAANKWRVYFQKLDREMHSKVLQQQLLDVMVRFLDAHNVDTSQIKDRGSHILNNGVIVSGGTISAESLAVGEGAQANVSKRRGRAAQATT